MLNEPPRERTQPGLSVGSVLLAYLVLGLGFVCIGISAQSANIVWGLWITEALAIALPALIWVRAAGVRPADYLGFKRPKARWFAIAALTALVNQPVVSLLTWLAQQALPHKWVLEFEAKNNLLDGIFSQQPLAMIAAVAISAPLGEELFFRGFALPAAARSMRPLFAALLTAALFSLMHFDAVGALGLFEIGLWLAVLRWGSGSIFPSMLGHALNNAIAGAWFLLGLQSAGRTPPAWANALGIDDPDGPPPLWVLIAGTLLALLGAYLAAQIFARPSPGMAREAESEASRAEPPGTSHLRAWPLWTLWGLAVIAGAAQLWTHH